MISTAIAVLVIAFLGLLMWMGFPGDVQLGDQQGQSDHRADRQLNTSRRRLSPVHRVPDRGSGTLSAAFGVTVFLAFMLLATHVLVNLWVSSLVDHVAWDTARRAASDPRYASEPGQVQAEGLSWARSAWVATPTRCS
ncbi:MAG: hypothetical protein IPH38_20895 [Candidatus Microthrix sp.]|nr:hypothetical protein [Candidatus Microthrix sp.]MBK7021959.1 hypothetical protein [Candidatus Microthrix sp.]